MSAQLLEPDVFQAMFTAAASDEEIGQTLRAVARTTGRPVLVRFVDADAVTARLRDAVRNPRADHEDVDEP